MSVRKNIWVTLCLLAGIAFAVWAGCSVSAQRLLFCLPAGKAAALLLGSPGGATAEGFRVFAAPAVHVTLACSGLNYFFIVTAALVYAAVQQRRFRFLAAAVPAAYLLTLLANTARIVCGWHTRVLAQTLLPERWYGLVHMGTGIVCFLMTLLIAFIFIQRSWSHDPKSIAS